MWEYFQRLSFCNGLNEVMGDLGKKVSRAGEKLEYALAQFGVDVTDKVCADFGSNAGGFVETLLKHGAKRVFAVETGYGVLDFKLRRDPRVIVMERTNAMHVQLPEKAELISIDVSWTPQMNILPNAVANLTQSGDIISLIKPHYEATSRSMKLTGGKLDETKAEELCGIITREIDALGLTVIKVVPSPIVGEKAGNVEYLFWIKQRV